MTYVPEEPLQILNQLIVYEVVYRCYGRDGSHIMGGTPELILAMSFDEVVADIKDLSEQDIRPPEPAGDENNFIVSEIEILSIEEMGRLQSIGDQTLCQLAGVAKRLETGEDIE